ncbi:MAG TPA: FUSC family protein, partial [Cellulomonas sp.]
PADILAAVAVASGSAGLAVLVGLGGALSPTRRARERASSPPFGIRRLVEESAVRRHALRYGLAVLAAGAVATLAGIGHPGWAMVAAVVPLAVSDTPGQLLRAGHRLGGTAVGLLVAAGLFALHPAGWQLVVLVVALQTVAELFVVRNYGFAMVVITPLALLMNLLVGSAPTDVLLRDRALETLIGAVIGILVALVSTRLAGSRGVATRFA